MGASKCVRRAGDAGVQRSAGMADLMRPAPVANVFADKGTEAAKTVCAGGEPRGAADRPFRQERGVGAGNRRISGEGSRYMY